uniref:Conserved_ORF_6 protein n=1 Tax=Titanophycus setchellii TaxID=940129 RepID=A0A1G4NYG9_9FLOR|nr:hypothetical protein P8471_pgp008 [Titanophycus setchellii]SCW23692.1 conserved_ORF_6 [Titanophycus setchellii]
MCMFLYHNYDMLLIAVQSLDPYCIDKLVNQSYKINIIELFIIRTNSIMRYTEISDCHRLYYIFILTKNLSSLLCCSNTQHNTQEILKDIANNSYNSYLYSNNTKNYIKRFTINYRKSCAPYLIGYDKYTDNLWITKLSIINLFLIYQINTREGIYFMFFYIIYNYRKV